MSPDEWYLHWSRRAESVFTNADTSQSAGHQVSARNAYMRACEYYRQAYFFLRHDLTDVRLLSSYASHCEAFSRAAALMSAPPREVFIPFKDNGRERTLHGWFFSPCQGSKPRPTVVIPAGYDSTAEAGWATAAPAVERGYNALSIEGPGQGRCLYVDKMTFRPDAEIVYSRVLDWVLAEPTVDSSRVAMLARSFAGYLGPRSVAADSRWSALVCDPAQPDMGVKIPSGLVGMVAAPIVSAMMNFSKNKAEFFGARMASHGVNTINEYFDDLRRFTMVDMAYNITCPTYILESVGDFAGGGGRVLFDSINSPVKSLVAPSAETGLSGHCGGLGQRVWESYIFDWLDTVLR